MAKRNNNNKTNKKPRSPISAYNIFYQTERQRLLDSAEGKRPNFRDLAKYVSADWKKMNASDKVEYVQRAYDDKKRYARELVEWHRQQAFHKEEETCDKATEETKAKTEEPTMSKADTHQPIPFNPNMTEEETRSYSPEPFHATTPDWMSSSSEMHHFYQALTGYAAQTPCVVPPSPTPAFESVETFGSLHWVANELGRDGVRLLVDMFAESP